MGLLSRWCLSLGREEEDDDPANTLLTFDWALGEDHGASTMAVDDGGMSLAGVDSIQDTPVQVRVVTACCFCV